MRELLYLRSPTVSDTCLSTLQHALRNALKLPLECYVAGTTPTRRTLRHLTSVIRLACPEPSPLLQSRNIVLARTESSLAP